MSHKKLMILDSTLREGQQGTHPIKVREGIVFSKEQQLEIAKLLVGFGVDYIEVGSPVRSSFSEKIISELLNVTSGSNTQVVAHCRCIEEDVVAALECGVSGINLYMNSSNFSKFSRDDVVKMAEKCLAIVNDSGSTILKRFSFEDSFRTDWEDIKYMLSRLVSKTDRIGFPDTTGMAYPSEVAKLISSVRKLYPDLEVEVHFHNDAGLAVANALYAFKSGASVIDVSILGIGERDGTVSLSGLIAALYRDKVFDYVEKKYDLKYLPRLVDLVSGYLGIEPVFNLPIASSGAFSHAAGVHASSQIRDENSYLGMDPEIFGLESTVCWASSVVGKASILYRASMLGIDLDKETASGIADKVREKAKENGGINPDEVDKMIKS